MNNKLNKIIEQIKYFDPEKIILFGSYAYGTPNYNSDIDLLVVKNNEPDLRELNYLIRRNLLELICAENIELDLFIDNDENIKYRIGIGDLFYNEIISKGKVIYAK